MFINKKLNLNTSVKNIPGIGPNYQKLLKSLGIKKVIDFLFYFPRRYDDFSIISSINQVKEEGQIVTIKGKVWQIKNQRSKIKRKIITLANIVDETGAIEAIWFNQPFLTKIIKNNEEIILSGKVKKSGYKFILQNPVYELLNSQKSETIHSGRIVPVYNEIEGLTSRWLRLKIKFLLPLIEQIKDYLPQEIIRNYNLVSLPRAIYQIHFPDSYQDLKRARYRLAFDELFLIQLSNLQQKLAWQNNKAYPFKINLELIKNYVKNLPFSLTNAQKKASWEILKDLEKEIPMNRLLEGDVGSGKTVVASLAILTVIKNGFQVAYMAPTEILARQHFQTLQNLFKKFSFKITLLLGSLSSKEKKESLSQIKLGKSDLIIGTHALIQESITFPKLGLVIIDEQHRFGVEQRAILRKKNKAKFYPHFLTMTATPIPRTLALAIYGDLDLSIIDEMPPGRQKIITKIVRPFEREKVYEFIKKEILASHQVFVICPLIEDSDYLGVKSVKKEYEKLSQKIFPQFKIALLHGRMKGQEKEKTMEDFKNGLIDILISTSVVEVGIDVPNATVMMIEGAERFGLAQLHQFRGRVGRGEKQSYCFLFTENPSGNTFKRLYALVKCENGFELAEKDLAIRGPGEIYGLRQHGIPDLKMASLQDILLIKKARQAAEDILKKDEELKNYPLLVQEINKFKIIRHLE